MPRYHVATLPRYQFATLIAVAVVAVVGVSINDTGSRPLTLLS